MAYLSSQQLIIILCALCLHSLALAQEQSKKEIVLGTFAYPPLMYDKEDAQGRRGIGLDIIKRAFISSDKYTLKIKVLPIKRSMEEIKRDRIDLFLGSRLDLPSLKNDIIAIQVTTLTSVLFCFAKECDIANKKDIASNLGIIASIPGSPVNEKLKRLGNEVTVLQSLLTSFKFLIMKRADYVAAIDFSGYDTLQKIDLADANKIVKAKFNILEIPYDVVIRKKHPHAKEISNLIKESLKSIQTKLTSKNLVKDYLNGDIVFK